MLALTILSIFVLIVISIIIYEVKNEKKYQAKRRKRKEDSTKQRSQQFPNDPIIPIDKKLNKSEKKESQKPTKSKIVEKNTKKLPSCSFPKFTHVRLVTMGLSEEESKEFVQELIPQIEIQIPLIEIELKKADFHQMERLTHSLKGSATNLGTGGISDLLVECNTYLKTGTDADIAEVYFEYLKYYTKELREQYL